MTTVKCPRCGSMAEFSIENKFRPFCSERCKMIDLGDWAEGRYAIPVSSPLDEDGAGDSDGNDHSKDRNEDDE